MNDKSQDFWRSAALAGALAFGGLFAASCTSTPVPPLQVALADASTDGAEDATATSADLPATEQAFAEAANAGDTTAGTEEETATDTADTPPLTQGETDVAQTDAAVPAETPQTAEATDTPAAADGDETDETTSDVATARVAEAAAVPLPQTAPRADRATASAEPQANATTAAASGASPTEAIASAAPTMVPQRPKPRGFLASLFAQDAPRPIETVRRGQQTVSAQPRPVARTGAGSVTIASVPPGQRVTRALRSNEPSVADSPSAARGTGSALPGVRAESLFEINRKGGGYDDSDIDANEYEPPVRVASVTGLARLAPNGLSIQHSGVDVRCLRPQLVRVLKTVERRFGRKVIVTSGYRSPSHNRRARGARNSLHMYCAAADIKVPGVSKWTLAKYLRSMPGRGGVGTYCHTNSVHIDIGPERDWNWRCRRKSRKRR